MSKKIIITESQLKTILSLMVEENTKNKKFSINPEQVLIVKKFLDKNFQKGLMTVLGNDGLPTQIEVVSMINPKGEVMKNLYKEDMTDILIDKFKNMFLDHNQRDRFMKKVMED